MHLNEFRQLSKKQQAEVTRKKLMKLKKNQQFLEENGTFTFYDSKKTGGLVMEYKPNK